MKDERDRRGHEHSTHPQARSAPARSEFDFIERIRARARNIKRDASHQDSSLTPHPSSLISPSSLVTGIGDDAAVFRSEAGRDTVVTADLLVEDVDFFRRITEPASLGHKSLAVSLSDVAAMGARPRFALVSLGVPQTTWDSHFLDDFYEGFLALAAEHGVVLVGGDVSRSPDRIVIDSIVVGEVESDRAVLRSGARVGDQIFVTGALGGAAAGLRLLEKSLTLTEDLTHELPAEYDEIAARQTRPAPRVEWGAHVCEGRLATAMIDLSDGLSSDLAHLCRESGVGAVLDWSQIPVHPALSHASTLADNSFTHAVVGDAHQLARHGGEDFELLFTVHPRDLLKLPRELGGVAVTRVGEITEAGQGIKLLRHQRPEDLHPGGFDHFHPHR
ncbi:MAG TPA: thiamine-phosphate kinase [Pyrinomonadaceae bacterium]|nr:thiamine-phosphate kinase [Pyrinomonadaceae bacterium]